MTVGAKLIRFRRERRLSQHEVAERLGISQSAYSQWESEIRTCRIEYLPELARIFDVSVTDVLSGYHETNQDDKDVASHVNILHQLIRSKDELITLLKEEITRLKQESHKQHL